MIISASRRTDLPAFHASWFMDRVRAGFCLVPNPMYPKKSTAVDLTPSEVDAIVFWTKNPRPLMADLPELTQRGYKFYFQYTVTGYGETFEPRVPALGETIETFRELAESTPVVWRYDPILFTPTRTPTYHAERFGEIARALKGSTSRVVVSIVDLYGHAKRNLRQSVASRPDGFDAAIASMVETATECGMQIQSCSEELQGYGIEPGKCIDGELLKELFDLKVTRQKDPSQRKACGCVKSRDIGTYGTCKHGCKYCYAVR